MINYHDGTLLDLDAQEILDNQAPFTFDVEGTLALRFKLTKRKEQLLSKFPDGYTNSSNDIINLLKARHNWTPSFLTKNNNPSTSSKHLELLDYPEIDLIVELKEIDKILSYIKSWLKYQSLGKIAHTCTSIGSATHRASHSNPNLGAIPSHGSLGKLCRELFRAPEDMYIIGVDLSGIELRCLAHYLFQFDSGKYSGVITNGDIHKHNADALGSTRDVAKVFVYAWLYGAGNESLRQVLGYISKEETARMRQSFTDKIDGLSALRDAVEKKVRTCGYINAIDKRKIYVDGVYKSMNYLLQSTAAVVAKTWMVLANKRLKEKYNNKFNQLAFVHDELQFQVDSSIDKEEFIAIVKQAAADAGKELGLRVPVIADAKSGYSWAETH